MWPFWKSRMGLQPVRVVFSKWGLSIPTERMCPSESRAPPSTSSCLQKGDLTPITWGPDASQAMQRPWESTALLPWTAAAKPQLRDTLSIRGSGSNPQSRSWPGLSSQGCTQGTRAGARGPACSSPYRQIRFWNESLCGTKGSEKSLRPQPPGAFPGGQLSLGKP